MAIKITSFMTAYKFKKTDEEKLQMVKEHIKNEYVPYDKKADYARMIVDSSYWNNINGEKVLHVDSVAKYMLTCMAIVDLYTDIERQKFDGKMLEDFNTLNGSGVLDLIIDNINSRELKEFNMVLQMTCEDVMTNEYENHAYLTKQLNRFKELLATVLEPLVSKIDVNEVEGIIKKYYSNK